MVSIHKKNMLTFIFQEQIFLFKVNGNSISSSPYSKLQVYAKGYLVVYLDKTASSDFAKKQMGERAKFFADLGWEKSRGIS